MSGQVIAFEDCPMAYVGISKRGNWIFRGMNQVFSWSLSDPSRFAWYFPLEGDMQMGLKLLTETQDLVVTFSDLGKQGTVFYGLDPDSGGIIWEKQYDFRPEEAGLATNSEYIIIQGSEQDRCVLVCLDGSTGNVLEKSPSISGQEIQVFGQHIFIGGGDGLFRTSIDQLGQFEQLQPITGSVSSLIRNEESLYFLYEDEQDDWEFKLAQKSVTSSAFRQVKIEADREAIFPVPIEQNRVAILPGEGLGVALINLGSGDVVWQVGLEQKWTGHEAILTPLGLIVRVEPSEEKQVIKRIDISTGQELELPQFQLFPWGVFWLDNTLVITGTRGMQAVELE